MLITLNGAGIATYTVHTNEEGLRITGLRWGVNKSSQEVDTGCTSGCMLYCITAILHGRVVVIPAVNHTSCFGLQNNQLSFFTNDPCVMLLCTIQVLCRVQCVHPAYVSFRTSMLQL